MKAMILSAGRGERMRPLTDELPKPLLEVHEKPLIVYHIEKLASAGFSEIVINIAHLGGKIVEALGDGSAWNIKISYSDERECGALESAGGIIKALPLLGREALPLLGREAFLVVNGDVFCEYEFDAAFCLGDKEAHLILVPNPKHNLKGDFGLKEGDVLNEAEDMYTFSGIAYYKPSFFEGLRLQKSPLAPLIRDKIKENVISGEVFNKVWHDIGTPSRLKEINNDT